MNFIRGVFMKNNKLSSLAISESGFIFDPSSGHTYITNELGVKIIELLKNETSNEEITEILIKDYEVDISELEADIQDFVYNLQKLYLV